jgi:hypothetical protein
MEKTYISYYPFSVSAETKTSKAGKEYLSIGICQKSKDKDGNKKETYFNLIDERELLVLASACENMYHRIMKAKSDEFLANKSTEQPQEVDVPSEPSVDPAQAGFEDEVPF